MQVDSTKQSISSKKVRPLRDSSSSREREKSKVVVKDRVELSDKAQKLITSTKSKVADIDKKVDVEVSQLDRMPKKGDKKVVSALRKRVEGSRFVNRPAIFFIGGFNFVSSTNDGMRKMAEHVQGARFYDWDQKGEILKEVLKRPAHQPIILVGHSLGGDTAVEIAQELNTLDNGFKKVNLLVTLDSFGFNNDIIPQNVERNLNFIGHKSWFLNDAPNIARDSHMTKVFNELRDETHTELDDSQQIQYKIIAAINETLEQAKA